MYKLFIKMKGAFQKDSKKYKRERNEIKIENWIREVVCQTKMGFKIERDRERERERVR